MVKAKAKVSRSETTYNYYTKKKGAKRNKIKKSVIVRRVSVRKK